MKSLLTSVLALSYSLTSFAADDVLTTLEALTTRASELKSKEISASYSQQKALADILERSYITRQRAFAYNDIFGALQDIKKVERKLGSLVDAVVAVDEKKIVANAAVHKQALILQVTTAKACQDLEKIVSQTIKSESYKNRIRLEVPSSVLYVTNEEDGIVDELVDIATSASKDCETAGDTIEVFVENSNL